MPESSRQLSPSTVACNHDHRNSADAGALTPYQLPPRTAVYNYRYFLPYAPEWGTAEQCQTRLRELLAFCHEARIDAVQFFVNTRRGTYYMPARSAAEQAVWARWMKEEVAPALREAGISYQLN